MIIFIGLLLHIIRISTTYYLLAYYYIIYLGLLLQIIYYSAIIDYLLDYIYTIVIGLLLHYISKPATANYLLDYYHIIFIGLHSYISLPSYLGSLHHTIEEHKALTERSGGRVDTERSGVSSRVGYADLISTCGMTGAERREWHKLIWATTPYALFLATPWEI